jgi:hypothetical protein
MYKHIYMYMASYVFCMNIYTYKHIYMYIAGILVAG